MRHQPQLLKFLKEQYPSGTRIRLIEMQDSSATVPAGTEGTVDFVDNIGQIHMKLDNADLLPSFRWWIDSRLLRSPCKY